LGGRGDSNHLIRTDMAKKKDRAFFICPKWNEVVAKAAAGDAGAAAPFRFNDKILRAIAAGQPVARSTLRKALLAARAASPAMFDIDVYIVDQRAGLAP
jgi:hypothetical protein